MAIPLESYGAKIGSSLGTGLQALAQHKIGEFQRRQQQMQNFQGLQALQAAQKGEQLTPELAQQLSQLQPELLREYVKGVTNPRQALINQQIGGKIPLTPAQEKHRDMVRNSYEINRNLAETTERMLEYLKSGKIKTGLIPHLKSEYLPTQLNKESGIFAKDAANVLTWTTEAQRGLQSKYRIQQTLKGKPGLNQLPEVNEHVLTEINKRAKHNLKNFEKDYPGFNLEDAENYDYEGRHPLFPAQASPEGEVLEERPDASDLPDNTQWVEDNGERYVVKDGQWVSY
ncbi:MAG TPA: hypothetical protein VHA52_02290 [Candidatus Babeliaceae bacterium]|nr:hypothetical protein [Candidatus Babeliaceae bacterium]